MLCSFQHLMQQLQQLQLLLLALHLQPARGEAPTTAAVEGGASAAAAVFRWVPAAVPGLQPVMVVGRACVCGHPAVAGYERRRCRPRGAAASS